MRGGLLERVLQMLLQDVHGARHESGFRADGQRQRIERPRVRAERSGLGLLAEFRSRRVLPLGQAVNAVVEHQHLDAHVAAQHVNGVIAADGKRVAVAGGHPDFELGMRELDSRGHGRRAPVNGVEADRCSCNTGSGWSSRCRKPPRIFRAECPVRETPPARRREWRSRRSPGTSGLPGRSENLSWSELESWRVVMFPYLPLVLPAGDRSVARTSSILASSSDCLKGWP